MKPGDHPEFFRFPAPQGRSRESALTLDREGRFHDAGELVEHAKLQAALHTWIAKHPEDGRFILTNGYDWTYFTVEDVPFYVRSIREQAGDAILLLSDGTEEPLDPATMRAGEDGGMYLTIQHSDPVRKGPFEAKLSRFAQTQLGPFLKASDFGVDVVTKRGKASFSGSLE